MSEYGVGVDVDALVFAGSRHARLVEANIINLCILRRRAYFLPLGDAAQRLAAAGIALWWREMIRAIANVAGDGYCELQKMALTFLLRYTRALALAE